MSTLIAHDLLGPSSPAPAAEIQLLLQARPYKGPWRVNSIWLGWPGLFPALQLMLRDDLATLHYFPRDRHAGYRSLGDVAGLERGGVTTFVFDTPEQEEPVPNEFVVPFSQAMAAALEFLESPLLPASVRWFEL